MVNTDGEAALQTICGCVSEEKGASLHAREMLPDDDSYGCRDTKTTPITIEYDERNQKCRIQNTKKNVRKKLARNREKLAELKSKFVNDVEIDELQHYPKYQFQEYIDNENERKISYFRSNLLLANCNNIFRPNVRSIPNDGTECSDNTLYHSTDSREHTKHRDTLNSQHHTLEENIPVSSTSNKTIGLFNQSESKHFKTDEKHNKEFNGLKQSSHSHQNDQSVSSSNTLSSQSSSIVHRIAHQVNRNKRCRCTVFIFAAICALNVIFLLIAYDRVVRQVAVSQLALEETGVKYDGWSKTKWPIYYRITLFNLTNPHEFMAGDRPRVKEVGPFTYRLTDEKVNVTFHKENGTVTYRSKPTYFFEPDLSIGSEDDQIWTLNIPFVNAADAVKRSSVLQTVIDYAGNIHNFETVQHLSVKELLWGHPSNVLDWGRIFLELPYPHPKFGILAGINNSVHGSYTMHTGADDPRLMNAIYSWNGKTKLEFWSGEACNRIFGTDAAGFAPGVSPNDTLYIFNGQLCRSIPLVFKERVNYGEVQAYRFVPPRNVFSYGKLNPDNDCFCTAGVCPPSGVLDMKPCYWGASIAFSFPHFYQGDPVLRHMVLGLDPDPSQHSTEFDIFPDLGIPLRVKIRLQMNIVLDQKQSIKRARNFDLIFPVLWMEAGIDSLPLNLVQKLELAQNLPPLIKIVLLGLCGTFTLVFILLLLSQTILNWISITFPTKNISCATSTETNISVSNSTSDGISRNSVKSDSPDFTEKDFNTDKEYPLTDTVGFNTDKEYPITDKVGFNTDKEYSVTHTVGFNTDKEYPVTYTVGFDTDKEYPVSDTVDFNDDKEYHVTDTVGFSARMTPQNCNKIDVYEAKSFNNFALEEDDVRMSNKYYNDISHPSYQTTEVDCNCDSALASERNTVFLSKQAVYEDDSHTVKQAVHADDSHTVKCDETSFREQPVHVCNAIACETERSYSSELGKDIFNANETCEPDLESNGIDCPNSNAASNIATQRPLETDL